MVSELEYGKKKTHIHTQQQQELRTNWTTEEKMISQSQNLGAWNM